MQSIAPDTVRIEVTGEGVEISGVKRHVGWVGEVSRAAARYLLNAKMAKPVGTAKPAVAQESVDDTPAVAYDAQEPAAEESASRASERSSRVPRNRNK